MKVLIVLLILTSMTMPLWGLVNIWHSADAARKIFKKASPDGKTLPEHVTWGIGNEMPELLYQSLIRTRVVKIRDVILVAIGIVAGAVADLISILS